MKTQFTQRALVLLFVLLMAFSVRALTANFIRAHLDDPGWFPFGIYALFDKQAQEWRDGRSSIFWIDDATQTDKAIYAPGYPLSLAFIYKLSSSRLPQTVQNVQWLLDAISVLLVVGIGVTAFDWRAGLCAGGFAALWPLLATYGCVPLADAPTSWIILGATWSFLIALKRKSVWWIIVAGALVGVSCWLRANASVLPLFWAAAILLFVRAAWPHRLILAGAVVASALLIISPIVIRNAIVFHEFVPTGLGAGTNLLEGIGETERGAKEFAAPANDSDVLEAERIQANPPPGARFELYYPDGIERDRARARRALGTIAHHPFWYAGSVFVRMAAVLKYVGAPNGVYGSAGINVTAKKTLPLESQGRIVSFLVNVVGGAQSVLRYLLLPLMLAGICLGVRREWKSSALILTTIFYYLVIGSLIHTHIRYGLPMQALLTIFAALTMIRIVDMIAKGIETVRTRKV